MSERAINIKLFPSSFFLLTVLMVVLKVSGHLDWDWIWVFAPMWILPAAVLAFYAAFFALGIAIAIGVGIIAFVAWLFGR